MPTTIFVIGMDDFNRRKLDAVERNSDYEFRELFGLAYVRERQGGDAGELLEEAKGILDDAERREGRSVDGIVAYWDYPVQTMLPILRRRFEQPGPTLESVLKCEHKFWSRSEQRRVIPEAIPDFEAFDPFGDPHLEITLPLPYWIKPVKATNSQLGFLVRDAHDLTSALQEMRAGIGRYGHWFDQFLARADLPAEVEGVGGHHGVAETLLAGTQHTLSGWADGERIHSYGVVDSHTYPERSSFSRYQYPSRLDDGVTARMREISERLMAHLGFRHEAFNIEFFYDADEDRLAVLEVNPRMSQSHGDLYHKVDGAPNHRIAADLAVGRTPDPPRGEGEFRCAGKFYLRAFEDGVVTSAPTEEERLQVEERVPGALVELQAAEGDRLGSSEERDSYSFELAHVYLGADDERQLLGRYERCAELLRFEVEPAGEGRA